MSIEALKEAKSVIGSINSGKANALTIGGETVFWQREEWVRWALDEVLPLIDQAIAEAEKQKPLCTAAMFDEWFLAKSGLDPKTPLYTHPQPKREPEAWTPLIERHYKNGVLISQTIQYNPQGEKLPYPHEPVASGIEAQVCEDIAKRQQLGLAKYGMSVADNPAIFSAWLQHAYEECLDQAVYLKKAIELHDQAK